jgi:hypothetical protein
MVHLLFLVKELAGEEHVQKYVFMCVAAKNIGGRNLYSAHRVSSLKGVPVRTVVSGCIACHNVVITNKGKVYTWGKYAFYGPMFTLPSI